MPRKTPVQTRPAGERYRDLLDRMDHDLREECDLVVSDLLIEHERRVVEVRLAGVEQKADEQAALMAMCEQALTGHFDRCPGATDEDRARWRRKVEQRATPR